MSGRNYVEAICDSCGIEGACYLSVPVDEDAGRILGLDPDTDPGGGYTLCVQDCAAKIGYK